jgi:hypothetical protein
MVASEIVADLVNVTLKQGSDSAPHRLDSISEMQPSPEEVVHLSTDRSSEHVLLLVQPHQIQRKSRRALRPLKQWDVYADYFNGIIQGGPAHLRHVKRILLIKIVKVF